jgi:thiamine monophosphate synthase
VCRAADAAGADWVDMACDPVLFKKARAITACPLMVSSVDAHNLIEAANWGADAVEVGNFDALYDDGYFITANEVLSLARKVIAGVKGRIPVSVTVPGHLSMETQLALAVELEAMGASMIQTEGASAVVTLDKTVQTVSAQEKAQRTLNHVHLFSQVVSIPVLAASGLHAGNVAAAIEAGAAGVGIGSAVNKLASVDAMVTELTAINQALEAATPKAAQKTLAAV